MRGRVSFAALISALVVVFILGVVQLLRTDYDRSLQEAEEELSSIAELLEQSVEATMEVANLQMWHMIDRISLSPLGSTEQVESRFGDLMRETAEEIDQIDSLVLIDLNGNAVWATVNNLNGRFLGDRQYFKNALRLGVNEYAVGVPLIARGSGRRLTPIAWPVISPFGRVHGVIVSSLGEEFFSELLTFSEFPSDLHVDIQASNGAAAFHSSDTPREIGEDLITATRDIASLGLTIDVSRSKSVVMKSYFVRAIVFVVVAFVLFATSIGMTISGRRKSVQLAAALQQSTNDNQRIIAAQREFNAIFDSVGDGIAIFTESGELSRTNKVARDILGCDNNQSAVERLRSLLPDFSEISNDFDVVRITPDETHPDQTVQCRMMKLSRETEDVAYCVLTDVTAEERLTAARTGFITSVNHELRTPLTSLAGSLDLLQSRFSKDLPAPALRLVAMASRNADRLLMLVNDILTLQAIDQGKFHVKPEPVPVSTILEEAVGANAGYGVATKVGLVVAQSVAGEVFVDPDRIQQIFSNLVSNAIKYSPPETSVEIGAQETDGEITFFVRDSGPGIPQAARERLFDRFTTPIHGRGVQMSGTGLGLAITKQLVERQGGRIFLESRTPEEAQEESGTAFYVTFPRYDAATASLEGSV